MLIRISRSGSTSNLGIYTCSEMKILAESPKDVYL